MNPSRHEFTAQETRALLDELDQRLSRRGVAASIFVVGGAAIAATGVRRERITADVDALTHNTVVTEEAHALARERELPENWLNPSARMWVPPLPKGVCDPPDQPGSRVTYADDRFPNGYDAPAAPREPADRAESVVVRPGNLGRGWRQRSH